MGFPLASFNFLDAAHNHPSAGLDSYTAGMARIPGPDFSFRMAANHGLYKEELWQACAGPLVSVPKIGDQVFYFPQGHIEQVAASTGRFQGADQLLPQSNLPSQIPCRVISRELSAEIESDEVFAQISLLPVSEEGYSTPDIADASPSPQQTVGIFTKILTASDTSTHGGFSVLRKHAEECLPPLDMSQENPSQDLSATDLHGQEWRFRHTYRGHPRRHLLTTGWSHFVSQKKLVAGDAVVFLRGENGELRVGIRRTKRQPMSQSSNVLTSDCMHMGVIASAAYAIQTKTMFSVYYKPRASPSSFIVPEEKFRVSLSNKISVGMRFKMRLEGEDATERSYAGTVTCIEDLNSVCWSNSKWRSLRVNWDEFSHHEQCERISPWEIEICTHPQAPSNLTPGPKSKRFRGASNMDIGSSSKSLCAESSLSSLPNELTGSHRAHDLQVDGPATPYLSKAGGLLKGHQHLHGHQKPDLAALAVECRDIFQPKVSTLQGRWLASGNMDPGQSISTCYSDHAGPPLESNKLDQHLHALHPDCLQVCQRGVKDAFSFFPAAHQIFGMQDNHNDRWPLSQTQTPIVQGGPGSWQPPPSYSHYAPIGHNKVVSKKPSLPPLKKSSSEHQMGPEKPALLLQDCTLSPFAGRDFIRQDKAVDNGCKIFGISLNELSAPTKLTKPSVASEDSYSENPNGEEASIAAAHVLENELPQKLLSHDKSVSSEADVSDSSYLRAFKDADSRSLGNLIPLRSCTKVIKTGSMVGRGVDLSKYDCYKKLLEELEGMFHIEGELSDPSKGWQVAYSDNEGDMMHVGDDPWMEFCRMVRKIYIFSPEEACLPGISQTKYFKDEHPASLRDGDDHRKHGGPAHPG